MTSSDPAVVASIIVCTHNRAELLRDCLRSILADNSTTRREIIVVDNGSSDRTYEVVADAQALQHDMRVRYIRELTLGKSYALNRGIAAASGALYLLTDDDVIVEDGWADALVRPFSDPAVIVAAGRVLPAWPFPPPAWLADGPQAVVLTLPDLGPSPRALSPEETPVGANMALRGDRLLGSQSLFDPSLGPRGRLKFDYEEISFVQRIRANSVVRYEPAALVRHRIQAERMERSWLRRTYLHHGFGAERFEQLARKSRPNVAYRLAHFALTAVRAWWWRRRNDRSAALDARAVDQELQTFAWVGRATERLVGRFPRASDWLAERLA